MKARRFRRIPFEAAVRLEVGRDSWTADLLDVAMRGALVGTIEPLPLSLGSRCQLRITLPGTPISLDFDAELVHIEATVGAGGLRRVDGRRTVGLNVVPHRVQSISKWV